MQNQSSSVRFLLIKEISDQYDRSVAAVRLSLNKRLDKLVEGTPDERREETKSAVRIKGKGRKADTYREDFVIEAMGEPPAAGHLLGETEKRIFGKAAKWPSIKVVAGKVNDPLPLTGVLASRRGANAEYNELVNEMTRRGHGLRIRCITGTDFFNSQFVWYGQLTSRIEAKLGPPRVLLVFPFDRAANLRSSAEGEPLAVSQFKRDALSTYEFLRAYSFGKDEKDVWVSVKWADEIPPSLLIWTEECALVEPYDYGGRGGDRAGCIGRQAPILVVSGGTNLHKALKDAFDYVYEEKALDEKGQPYIRTYTLKQVGAEYIRRSKLEARDRTSAKETPTKLKKRSR